jgi:hypothetical protein
MSSSPLNTLGVLISVMLFYSVAITLVTYALPVDMREPLQIFNTNNVMVDIEETTGDLENVVDRQLNVPLFDLGALAFYSGNLVVDLFLNFIFAIPGLAQIILSVLFMFMQIDVQMQLILKLFVGAVIMTGFVLMIVTLILRVRSPGSVV